MFSLSEQMCNLLLQRTATPTAERERWASHYEL